MSGDTSLGTVMLGGAGSEAAFATVYQEVMDRSRWVLAAGRPVVIDASFRNPALRSYARRLASHAQVPCRFIACTAPRSVLRGRLQGRPAGDGAAGTLDEFLAHYSAPTGSDVMTVDTHRGVDLDAVVSFARHGRPPPG